MAVQTPPNVYKKGSLLKVQGTYKDSAGTVLDPTVVKLSVKDPSGNVLSSTYGSGTGSSGYLIEKTSVGIYTAEVDLDESGTWYYRWWSTGTGQASEELSFIVEDVEAE